MKLVGNSKNFVDVKIFEGKLFADNRGQFSKPFYGDILDVKDNFKKSNMGLRFNIINIDVNLYEPIKIILENNY